MRSRINGHKIKKMLGAVVMTVASIAYSGSYPAPVQMGPSSSYAFPATFSAFDLTGITTNAAPPSTAPQVSEWTRINEPGDTMALTGNGFSAFNGVSEGRDSRFVFYGQGAAAVDGLIQRLDNMQVAVSLPTSLPPNEVYLMWPRSANGFGPPVMINQAEAWWVGSDRVSATETFSVYGRNLMLGSGSSHLYIAELNRWLESVAANPYKADFTLPNDIPSGTYTVWSHNGHGREFGWAASAQSITVVNQVIWNGGTYNVKDYGAKGDGSTDDYSAISAAINAANNSNYSTVYFPAGTYRFSGTLPTGYKSRIRYLGDGMDQTTLKPHANYTGASASGYLIFPGGDDSKYERLTLSANQYGGDRLVHIRDRNRIDFESVRFSQLESPSKSTSLEVIDTHKARHIKFKGCEFILTGAVFYGNGTQIQVDHCDFYGLNDNNTIMASWGGKELSITDCTGQSYDSSDPSNGFGWCKGRFFHCLGVWGATHEVYFGGNTTTEMTPRDDPSVDQNSGEQFMSEGEIVQWRASPSSATATSVTLPGISSGSGNLITVVDGRGFGQTREVVSVNAGVVTVDAPWNVVPDSSSVVVVGTYTRRMIVYDNVFEGTDRAVNSSIHSATTAVEPYGGAVDWVVVGNTMRKLRNTISQFSIYKDRMSNGNQYVCAPHYFNIYKDNILDSCRTGINIIAYHEQRGSGSVISDPSFVGMLYRNNVITNAKEQAIKTDETISAGRYALTVFDGNRIDTTKDCVVEAAEGQENYVWIGNTFSGAGTKPGMTIAAGHVPTLRDNSWTGFSEDYAGISPGAVLELPLRYVGLDETNTSAVVNVYNSGTEQLDWAATTSSDWVELGQSGSTVVDERSLGVLTVSLAPQASPAEGEEAIITVTGGGQTKQMTVVYAAEAGSPPPPPPPPAPVLADIVISGPATMDGGATAQFVCIASYSDGTSAPVAVNWSENSTVTTINSAGFLSASPVSAEQIVTITASFEGKSDTFALTVEVAQATLSSIAIIGPASLDEQTTAQYICIASYSDQSTATVTPNWSENSGAASIDSTGLLTGKNVTADQNVTVTASFNGQTDTHVVTITYVPAALTSISISGPASLDENTSVQLTCTASYADGSSASVVPSWSENSAVASINGFGVLTASNIGADQGLVVSASYGGQGDTHAVTINFVAPPVTLESLSILGPASLEENSTAQYLCTAHYSDGTSHAVAPAWSTDSAATASVDNSGMLHALNIAADAGLTVTASYGGKARSQAVTVWVVGDQVAFPLSGFTGKTISAELWDETTQELVDLGQDFEPEELVIENVVPDRWYWLGLREHDEASGTWTLVHGSWIKM